MTRSPLEPLRRALATSDLGPRSRQELEAVLAALVAAAVGLVVGLVVLLGDTRPISAAPDGGPDATDAAGLTVATVASILAAGTAATTFAIAFLRSSWRVHVAGSTRVTRLVRMTAAASLTVVCAGFAYIAVQALGLVFQEGFVGLELDGVAGAIAVALACAGAAYLARLLGEQVDTAVLGALAPSFLAVGVLFSMLTASDDAWWQVHFSSLGAGGGISGFAFNATLIVSGLLVMTMAAYVGHDLERAIDAGERAPWVGRLLALVGLLMLLTGVVQVDVAELLHIGLAAGMVLVFCILCALMPRLAPRLPRGVHVASIVLVAATIGALLLWIPFGYYNFTGFEFAACGLIFVWLTVFLRAISAAAGDRAARSDA
ncbi:DUF998 domain-containing protein [Agrococcus sp. SGAir0287]|uniref:DUF998 domain-containing protein n=1 Tax=Agrococcus sp. SGAir0287 TaxID=2070347 RepID=UPI0010CCC719|nr:DUF998 domain-containing protein [Agrococcus sp. SGAir0287]QCR20436.1 hypothetical protein C1N71_14110 [Agrococcus sp. SGAir0287]